MILELKMTMSMSIITSEGVDRLRPIDISICFIAVLSSSSVSFDFPCRTRFR